MKIKILERMQELAGVEIIKENSLDIEIGAKKGERSNIGKVTFTINGKSVVVDKYKTPDLWNIYKMVYSRHSEVWKHIQEVDKEPADITLYGPGFSSIRVVTDTGTELMDGALDEELREKIVRALKKHTIEKRR